MMPVAIVPAEKMHADELEIDDALVRRLLVQQFPEWSELALRRIEPAGTDNAIFRLGDDLSLRFARVRGLRNRAARSSTGCRGWPRYSPSKFRSRSRRVATLTSTRGSGTSTDGSRARRFRSRRWTRSRRRATWLRSSQRCSQWTQWARRRAAVSRWPSETRRSGTGWRGSTATTR